MSATPGIPRPLSPERWRRIEPLLDRALALPDDEIPSFLAEVSAGDPALSSDVAAWLEACRRLSNNDHPLDRPAVERFAFLLDDADERSALEAALEERYVIEGEAGRGGMGIVYRARDLRHQRYVALKVLRGTASEMGAVRFRREIALASRLQHPHIVPVFDSGEAAGRLWYTMPFIDGESLGDRRRRRGRLSTDEAIRFLRELADALACAHSAGVVHRDLKPDNILLSGDHAVVADFGVAKALHDATVEAMVPVTERATGVAGTPAYMAPEQARGEPGVDHRVDLYALGVIGWELIADASPAPEGEEPPLPPDVPVPLRRLLRRLRAASPEDRPKGAAQVRDELEAIARTTAHRMRPWPRRAMLGVAAAIVVLAGTTLLDRPVPAPQRRVLVVPFENASADSSFEYLRRVAPEWITQELARTGYVDVVSELMPAGARGNAASVGAAYVVSGGFVIVGDSIQMRVRVVESATQRVLPGTRAVTAARDAPHTLLPPLTDQVLVILGRELDPRMATWNMGAPPGNLRALQEFAEGLDEISKGNPGSAIGHWDRAATLDTTYMQPHLNAAAALSGAGLLAQADSHLAVVERRRALLDQGDRVWLDFSQAHLRGDLPRLLEAAESLVRIEGGAQLPRVFLAGVAVAQFRPRRALEALRQVDFRTGRFRMPWAASHYFALSTEAYHQLGDHSRELQHARLARALHPEHRDMMYFEARALAALGREREVDSLLTVIERLSVAPNGLPIPIVVLFVASELEQHGQHAAATRVLERIAAWMSTRRHEEESGTSAAVAEALYLAGRHAAAAPLLDAILRDAREDPLAIALTAVNAERLGQVTTADSLRQRLATMQLSYDRGHLAYARAQLAAQRGDTAVALDLLESALRKWIPTMGRSVHNDLLLAPLWKSDRLQSLVRPRG